MAARKTRKPKTVAARHNEVEKQLTREERAFRRKKKELLKKYENEYVALYQGEVVDHDPDDIVLVERARQKLGRVPFLIMPVRRKPIIFDTPMGMLEWG